MKKKQTPRPRSSAPSSGRDRPEFVAGFVYDERQAERPIDFLEGYLATPDGTGAPLRLLNWHKAAIRQLFGWRHPDGRMRYRRAAVFIPKKNRKSSLFAALGVFMTSGAHAPGQNLYVAAKDRGQARTIFDMTVASIKGSPFLDDIFEIIDSKATIRNKSTGRVIRCLSKDSGSNEGLNGSVLIDEIHAHTDGGKLVDALMYATRATKNSFVATCSTAGDDRNGIGFRWWHDAELVMKDPASNPTFMGLIYAADPEDDFSSEAVWKKANPALGEAFPLDEFRADYQDAQTDPRKMSRWLRYSLNVWTERDNRWFHGDEFTRCQADPPEPLEGRPCWVGIDLADHDDLTAAVFLFRSPDGSFDAELLAWVPEESMIEREKKQNIPYSSWVRDGWLTVTEGSRIDQEKVHADIMAFLERHECRGVGGDPYHLDWIATKMQSDGIEVHKIRQSIGYLTGPSKMLEDLVKSGKIRYRSPIMSWASNNVCIWEDPNLNIRPDKAKSSEKVDPIFALINALALASTDAEPDGAEFTLYAL